MKVDAYLRVSKVGGRTGESFISLDEQRRAIEAYAAAHGLELAEWWEDLDQSGGTLDRPEFQRALTRCRNGETGGLIAAKLDRLTRSTIGLGTLVDEARAGGWNLIAVDFGLDLFSTNGKLVADVLASVAEWERGRRRDDWDAARRNAVERGVPNGKAPFGYRKLKDGRFEVVEAEAAIVRDAFAKRADGSTFTAIGRPHGWAHTTIRQMLSNRAYLGVARSGAYVNERAHPAIISRELFEAAQAARTTRPVPPGDTTRDRLLLGLARCAGCGKTLKVVRRRVASGAYTGSYYCKDQASEPCPDRGYVRVEDLDDYVAAWFEGTLRDVPRMVDVVAAGRELEQAQAQRDAAENELRAYVETADAMDAALFLRGLEARQGRVTAASERVRHLSSRSVRLPASGSLIDQWGRLDAAARREVLASFISHVEVARGASQDLPAHVRILWPDGTLALAQVANDETGVRVAAA